MANFVMQSWERDQNSWMIYATRTSGVGGDLINLIPSSDFAPVVSPYGTHLIIDGVAMRIEAAGNTTGYLYLGSGQTTFGTGGFHYLGNFSIAAGVPIAISYLHLGIPYKIPSTVTQQTLGVRCTLAQNDTTVVSMWGHYALTPTTEPQEVTVKGVQFLVPKKKVGPL